MTFDNSKTIIGVRIKLFGATVVLLAYIALVYAAKLIRFPILGMNDTTWTLILVAVYLVLAFLPMILNYQYVFFSDDGESLVFRYFTAGIVGGKKNSVEINKTTFKGYIAESKYLGLTQYIVLYQKIGENTAKYPPIYISALKKDQRLKLFSALKKYTSET